MGRRPPSGLGRNAESIRRKASGIRQQLSISSKRPMSAVRHPSLTHQNHLGWMLSAPTAVWALMDAAACRSWATVMRGMLLASCQ